MAVTIDGTSGITTPGVVNSGSETIASTLQVGGITTNVYPLVSGTSQASTSGTSIDFTSIPSWVKRITVMFSGVSTSGTSNIGVRLGTASGIESAGYTTSRFSVSATSANTTTGSTDTTGFFFSAPTAVGAMSGMVIITNLTGNTWAAQGTVYLSGAEITSAVAGARTTATTLTQIRITTANGTDTFDAGSINILYE